MVHTICGHEESGGVYTRVQPYVSWIHSVMGAPITSGGDSDSLHPTSSTTWNTLQYLRYLQIFFTGNTTVCSEGFDLKPGNVPGRGFKYGSNQTLEQVSLLKKHCQRHNGPGGWVHLIKVTTWGHITSSNINLDQIHFQNLDSVSTSQPNISISNKIQIQNLDQT